MQDWETMIAERVAAHGVVVTFREQDPRRRNRQAYDRRHDKTAKRIAQHKAWAKSPAGKKSMHDRGARYRATEKGRLNALKKSRAYFGRHKYKRCLAMAKYCDYRFMNLEKMINTEYRTKKMRLSQRWLAKWLKLADKFKEAK